MTNIVLLSSLLITNRSGFSTWSLGNKWVEGDRKIVQEFRIGYVIHGSTPSEVCVATLYQPVGTLTSDGSNWMFKAAERSKTP